MFEVVLLLIGGVVGAALMYFGTKFLATVEADAAKVEAEIEKKL